MIISVKNKQLRYAIICYISALIISVFVKIKFIFPTIIDNSIHSFMAGIQTGLNDILMTVFSFLGSPILDVIYVLILAAILLLANLRIPAIWAVTTIILGNIFNTIIRLSVDRSRPVGHLLSDQGSSFPSSHVFGIFSVIFILSLLVIPNIESPRKQFLISWAITVIGVMTLMSRIYFNAHYLSDTIAAVLFAYAWIIFAGKLYPVLAKLLTSLSFFSHDEV